MKLSERLHQMLLAGALADNAGGVFVDMRPADFRALLREAAALARRVEDAEIAEPAMQSGRLVSVVVREGAHYKGQRLRLVPEARGGRGVIHVTGRDNYRATAERTKTCYQCNRPVTWLAPDSRCVDCTRLTPDEVGG